MRTGGPAADTGCTIRPVAVHDLGALLALCSEHAAYERSEPVAADDHIAWQSRLSSLLFADAPRLWAWIAEDATGAIGYASASAEVATWRACEYLHLDCIYLRAAHRGRGLGAALLRVAAEHARGHGYAQLQWQTPEWNLGAARFYRRQGASESIKRRYVLNLGMSDATAQPSDP